MPSPDFAVRRAGPADVDAILGVLSDGYGRPFAREWFAWKHERCPWGASHAFLAEDLDGPLGVGFALRWKYRVAGAPLTGWRLIDGATNTRAQRRGVFRAVVKTMLDFTAAQSDPGVDLATATPEARLAHIKNGATALEPIRSAYRPVRWAPARLDSGPDVCDSWERRPTAGIATDWDGAALRWRTDHLSGIPYRVSCLADADVPHGVVHRTAGGAARSLVVSATWGPDRVVAGAIRALAWQEKAVAVLMPGGPGTPQRLPRVGLRRGESLMCVWDQRPRPDASSASLAGWSLEGLDLEGVI